MVAAAIAGLAMLCGGFCDAAVLKVGPGRTYSVPCAAFAGAADGDVIEIDAGMYSGDVCGISKNRLTIRGVGGRPHIAAGGKNSGGKGTWVISGSDTVIEDVEMSGAAVPDRNGAAIRQEGPNLTLRRVFFHDNENGLLTGAGATSEILIENSEFARNGAGDGQSHNLYIGEVKKLTFRFNYSHHAKIGHELKTRAHENHILYNRLMNESTGTASYEIEIPQGGTTWIIGNLVQQGPLTDNSTMLAYAAEGTRNPGTDLYVVNNTFVNDNGAGVFVRDAATTPAVIKNNIFLGAGSVTNQPDAVVAGNFSSGDPQLVDRARFDYHLNAGSPCANVGVDAGSGGGIPLVPVFQYVHPASTERRVTAGATIDIGAYELGGGEPLSPDGGAHDAGTTDGGSSDAGAIDAGVSGAELRGGCGCGEASSGGLFALLEISALHVSNRRRTRESAS